MKNFLINKLNFAVNETTKDILKNKKKNPLINIIDMIILLANTIIGSINVWNVDFNKITATDIGGAKILYLVTTLTVLRSFFGFMKKNNEEKLIKKAKNMHHSESENHPYITLFYRDAIKSYSIVIMIFALLFIASLVFQEQTIFILAKFFSTLTYLLSLYYGCIEDLSDLYNLKPQTFMIS